MKLLVADDDATSRKMLEAILQKWGYEVVVARDGAEAWQALQAGNAPELAVLDWMMPEMDGLEVCRRVRAGGRTPPDVRCPAHGAREPRRRGNWARGGR